MHSSNRLYIISLYTVQKDYILLAYTQFIDRLYIISLYTVQNRSLYTVQIGYI